MSTLPVWHNGCPECNNPYSGEHLEACSRFSGKRRPFLAPHEHCPVCLRLSPIGTDCSHTGNLLLLTAGMDREGGLRPNQPQEPGLPSESPSHTEAA